MDTMELIKTRKSVRTFDGRMISAEDRDKLCAYIKTIPNPYDIPVEFVMLDAETYGDVQKIDMGITLCHFMSVTDGKIIISDPGIAIGGDTEYIATVLI